MSKRTLPLAGLLFLVACHTGDPLLVTHASPEGELDALPAWFEVHFDKPIIAADSFDPQAKGLTIRVTPDIKGAISFPTPSSLAYSFADAVPPATKVEVTLESGLRSADDKAVLKSSHTFSFTSERNHGEGLYKVAPTEGAEVPEEGDRQVSLLDLGDPLLLKLAYAERAEALKKLVTVRGAPLDGGEARELPVTLELPKGDTVDRVLIKPAQAWPKHTRLKVVLAKGLGVAERGAGPVRTSEEQVLQAATYPPLTVENGPICEQCMPPSTLVLEFSTPVTCEQAKGFVTLAGPKHELACAPQPHARIVRLEPTPSLRPYTEYTLAVKPGLGDAFGQTLEKGVAFTLKTGDAQPRVAHQTMFNVLERREKAPHEEMVYKAAALEVEGARLSFAKAWELVASQDLADQVAWRELPWWLSEDYSGYYEGDCHWDEERGEEVCEQTTHKFPGATTGEEIPLPGASKAKLDVPADAEDWAKVQVPLEPYLGGRGGVVVLKSTPLDAKGARMTPPVLRLLNVTDIGLSAKYSRSQLIVLAARLSDGAPIAGAKVSVYVAAEGARALGEVAATTTTDAQGMAVLRAAEVMRSGSVPDLQTTPLFIAAETQDDEAFIWSKFVSGGQRAYAGTSSLAGTVYTDRGIYRPGETVSFRAVLRRQTADGFATPTGEITVTAARSDYAYDEDEEGGDQVYEHAHALSKFGTASGSFVVPAAARVGDYVVRATMGDERVSGTFKVGEFRRAEMKVQVATDKNDYLQGDKLRAKINADYLFGAPAAGLEVRWTLRRNYGSFHSARYPQAGFHDYDYHVWYDERSSYSEFLDEGVAKLDDNGVFEIERALENAGSRGRMESLIVAATVDDASGQSVTSTSSVRVHPAEVHVGLVTKGYLQEKGKLFSFDVVAVTMADAPAAGVPVTVALEQEHWKSIKRRGPGGRMYWEYQRDQVNVPDVCKGKTNEQGMLTCQYTPTMGGSMRLRALAKDKAGREVKASTWYWVTGDDDYYGGRSDSGNQVGIMPEKPVLEVGETARLAIASPFKKALALVTVEREDILWRKVMEIGTTGVVELQIPQEWAPNVYVSATVVRGRVTPEGDLEPDPERDKPAYGLGYVKLDVKPTRNVLKLEVKTDRNVYEPAETVTATVSTVDYKGAPTAAEVNLYAVDEGVLMLTGYRTPDLIPDMFAERPYAVLALDTRMHVLGRRQFITPVMKGEEDGGGGGDGSEAELRKDFNPTATWIGALVTDGSGKATHTFKVPDTLTTYRVMAVAVSEGAQFGSADAEFKVNKTLMMRQAMPRFMRPADRADAGVVVNHLAQGEQEVTVALEKIDEALFSVTGPRSITKKVPAKGTVAFRFDITAKDAEGASQIIYAATMGKFRDRVQLELPVKRLQPRESVGVSGVIDKGTFTHSLELPPGARPVSFDMNLSGVPVASLEERLRNLVGYPYGCLEQRTSKVMPLIAVRELAEKMQFASIPTDKIKKWVEEWVTLVPKYRCNDDGFDYYPGCGWGSDPHLTAFALDGLITARKFGYAVPDSLIDPPARYLEARLSGLDKGHSIDGNSSGLAGALRVLAELGRGRQAQENLLFEGRKGLPLFARVELTRAIHRRTKAADGQVKTLLAELTSEGKEQQGMITFAAASGDYDAWGSAQRSTALMLRTLVQVVPTDARVPLVTRGLLSLDNDNDYYETQSTTQALLALAEAAAVLKAEGRAAKASVKLAGQQLFQGKDLGQRVDSATLAADKMPAQGPYELSISNDGNGPLYFGGFFAYAYPATARLPAISQGFRIERTYTDKEGKPIGDSVRVGDYVMVNLLIHPDENGRMVVIDDPLPAGLEPVDTSLATSNAEMEEVMGNRATGGRDWGWWRSQYREMRDDRTEWHFQSMWAWRDWPVKLRYLARATTAGTYYAPGTKAERMYQPHIRGRSEGRALVVKPKE